MNACSIDRCEKPVRSLRAEWCAMHYHRWYRHGDPTKTAHRRRTANGRRYVSRHLPTHPLAPPSGRIWVHRIVLFDVIGLGPHPCHWCATEVHWIPGIGQARLDVDHLDGFGDHNDPENLVPSCGPCNSTRAAAARHRRLVEQGWWSSHDTIAGLTSGGRRAAVG